MTVRLAAILLVASALAACGSGPRDNNAQGKAETPSANATAPAAGPVELNAAWLAGRWQSEGAGDCGGASDSYLTFEADGSYAFMQEQGRWRLEGDQLTIQVTEAAPDGEAKAGDSSTIKVRAVGPDEAEFTAANAPPNRVHRCRN